MSDDKQGDCAVCTGKEVVLNGVCRNCGAGKEEGGSVEESPVVSDVSSEAVTE